MGVFQLGDFTIQNLNQGWRVCWQKNSNRHSLDLDVEALIKQYIFMHLDNLTYLIHLFEKGPDDLLDSQMGAQIISAMPESDTIPGQHLREDQVKQWHYEQLIKGYNRVNGTNFTYDMVKDRL